MQIIDGKALAKTIKGELRIETDKLKAEGKRPPHLAAVLIGDNPASRAYVNNKVKSCHDAGYDSTLIERPADISQAELMRIINELNTDQAIDGFIVQLPLPKHIDEHEITLAISPAKDVDGFHPANVGRMTLGIPSYLPATPMGIMTMLARYDIDISGKTCCVLGRSNIVGTPISILLSRKSKPGDATVILCHSRTKDIRSMCLQADVIVVALGIPNYLKADMVKDGAVVIDVGINRVEDSSTKSGYRLTGDVDYEQVAPKCSFITPVPGGVGPMTVISLLQNTWKAYTGEYYPASK